MISLLRTYLPTEENNIGVWIIEWQEHSIAGVHLTNSHCLLHVLLRKKRIIHRSSAG